MDYSDYHTAPKIYRSGGVYQHATVSHSRESKKFIKELVQESQLAHVHRNFIESIIENGKSLPPLNRNSVMIKQKNRRIKCQSAGGKRRTQKEILTSGAYEMDLVIPRCNKVSVEKEKVRLQNLMAYGKDTDVSPPLEKPNTCSGKKKDNNLCLPSLEERFQEIVNEIEERNNFLSEMSALGQADQYKNKIKAETSKRVRELQILTNQMRTKVDANEDYVEKFKQILISDQ